MPYLGKFTTWDLSKIKSLQYHHRSDCQKNGLELNVCLEHSNTNDFFNRGETVQYHISLQSRELGQAPMLLVFLTNRQALSSTRVSLLWFCGSPWIFIQNQQHFQVACALGYKSPQLHGVSQTIVFINGVLIYNLFF